MNILQRCGNGVWIRPAVLLAALLLGWGTTARAADGDLTWADGFEMRSLSLVNVPIARDGANNCCVMVNVETGGDFDPGAEVTWLLGPQFDNPHWDNEFLMKLDPSGGYGWSKHLGGPSMKDFHIKEVAMDELGNVCGTCAFLPDAEIHLGPTATSCGSDGDDDVWDENVFLFKMDPDGNLVWVRRIGPICATMNGTSTSAYVVDGLVIDGDGNVVMNGRFFGTSDFDPGPGTAPLTSSPQTDGFLLKLDGEGNFVWVKGLRAYTAYSAHGDLAVDESNNILVSWAYWYLGASELFSMSKLDSDGTVLWQKSLPFDSSVQMNSRGDVLVSGRLFGTYDFDPGPAVTILTTASPQDARFLMRLTPSGDFMWAKGIIIGDGSGVDSADGKYRLAMDRDGYIYDAGHFHGTVDFDPGPGVANLTQGTPSVYTSEIDVFVRKLDPNGDFLWAKRVGGTGQDNVTDMVVNDRGYVWVTGRYTGTVDFDPGPGTRLLNGTEFLSDNFFVMQLAGTLGVTLLSPRADPVMTNPIPVKVAFDESVNGFTVDDLVVTNGTVTDFAGSGATYTFDLVPGADGPVTVDVAADAAQSISGTRNTAAAQLRRVYARDTDGDGLEDTLEVQFGTSPSLVDTDHDGFSDREEVAWDGVDREYEAGADTDPLNPDTDGDGVADGREAEVDHDPLDPADVPVLPMAAWPLWVGLLFVGFLRVRRLADGWGR